MQLLYCIAIMTFLYKLHSAIATCQIAIAIQQHVFFNTFTSKDSSALRMITQQQRMTVELFVTIRR